MDENQSLQDLVAQAQAHPHRSPRRRIALTKLLSAIRASEHLSRQAKWREIPNFQDTYDEALNNTLLEISERIDNYDSNRPVMAWINNTFNYRFLDVYNKEQRKGVTNLPRNERPIFLEIDIKIKSDDGDPINTREIFISTGEDLSSGNEKVIITVSDNESKIIRDLRDLLRTDPDGVLAAKHIENRPDVTFQKILLMKFCENKKWKEIADYYDTPTGTVTCFYYRSFTDLSKYLQESLL